MKQQKDAWDQRPVYDGPEDPGHRPHFSECGEEDSPEFATIRRIELVGRLHHMAFRQAIQDDRLPPAQAGALRMIVQFPGLSQRELADKLHIQRATATVMLQKMEKSGMIDRRPDRVDQRISRIFPTDMARAIDTDNQKNLANYFARCFQGITAAEIQDLNRFLLALGKNLHTILQETSDDPGKE